MKCTASMFKFVVVLCFFLLLLSKINTIWNTKFFAPHLLYIEIRICFFLRFVFLQIFFATKKNWVEFSVLLFRFVTSNTKSIFSFLFFSLFLLSFQWSSHCLYVFCRTALLLLQFIYTKHSKHQHTHTHAHIDVKTQRFAVAIMRYEHTYIMIRPKMASPQRRRRHIERANEMWNVFVLLRCFFLFLSWVFALKLCWCGAHILKWNFRSQWIVAVFWTEISRFRIF